MEIHSLIEHGSGFFLRLFVLNISRSIFTYYCLFMLPEKDSFNMYTDYCDKYHLWWSNKMRHEM